MEFTRPSREQRDRSVDILMRLTDEAGSGEHHMVMVLVDSAGRQALHDARFWQFGDLVAADPDEMANTCIMLALGLSGKHQGGFVMRTSHEGKESVCGWKWVDGDPRPLNRAEIFTAYCTDPDTGDPVSPEPGVEYKDAPVIHL